jgi:hypothetical protein
MMPRIGLALTKFAKCATGVRAKRGCFHAWRTLEAETICLANRILLYGAEYFLFQFDSGNWWVSSCHAGGMDKT